MNNDVENTNELTLLGRNETEQKLMPVEGKKIRTCKTCHQPFLPYHPAVKYCDACAVNPQSVPPTVPAIHTQRPPVAKARTKIQSTRAPQLHPLRYRELLKMQKGVCAACWKPESMTNEDGTLRKLTLYVHRVDSQVIGLICFRCEQVLSFTNHSSVWLLRLALFLQPTLNPVGAGLAHENEMIESSNNTNYELST